MNLIDAAKLAEMGLPREKIKVKSRKFFLTKIALNRLASPIKASSEGPIVVDVNERQEGKLASGFYPKVIVVSGQTTFRRAHERGDVKALVLIGNLAASKLDINADHMIGSDELREKLQIELESREGMTKRSPPSMSLMNTLWIKEVYPFEGYCIYKKGSQIFRQPFQIDDLSRSVAFLGKPTEMLEQYVEKLPSGMRMEAAASIYAHCGDTGHHDMQSCAIKGGSTYTMGAMRAAYALAQRSGYKPVIKAKSPPGWGGVVKKMKQHPDIDNPFALAHWANNQGYTPHIEEDEDE